MFNDFCFQADVELVQQFGLLRPLHICGGLCAISAD
jgi:hypothetical protein